MWRVEYDESPSRNEHTNKEPLEVEPIFIKWKVATAEFGFLKEHVEALELYKEEGNVK